MMIVRTLGWLMALALAVYVGLSSYVIANQVRAPARSLALGVPPSAIASGNVALRSYALRQTDKPDAPVSNLERGLAREAYRKEPLSETAVGILALAMTRPSEAKVRQSLIENGGKLSRRSALINRELIKSAGERGDNKSFFAWLSRSVLVNDGLRKAYITAMADATAKEGAVAALTPVIGPSPRWSETYWFLVSRRPASLANAAELRLAVARKPWNQVDITQADRDIARGLVAIGQFDTADELAAALTKGGVRQGRSANLLANANFVRQPGLPPFDWELAASGSLGSSIDADNGELLVSAIGGARGAAARQLVRLSPGRYSLGWSLAGTGGSLDAPPLTAHVRCAERGAGTANPLPIALAPGKGQAMDLVVGDSACRWYWFSIVVAMPDDSGGIDVRLRDLSLTPKTGNPVDMP